VVRVRRATAGDSQYIFDWRNDERTRQMSHCADVIARENHDLWYKSSLSDNSRMLIICEDSDSGHRLGVVRFDIDGKRALMSVNLAPDARGKGFSGQCLKAGIEYLKTINPDIGFIDAEIKNNNAASIRAFEGAGFVLQTEKNNILYYCYEV